MSKDDKFFSWVLIAKGIGIVLVVIGHFFPSDSPEYWYYVRNLIYSFHMPLFFILSGFLYVHGRNTYLRLISSNVKRLIYPFVSIAFLFFIIKYFSGLIFTLEYPVNIESIFALLVNPLASYMPLLWFVHALFLIFLVYPLVRNVISNNLVIMAVFVLFNFLLGNQYPVFGKALGNMPYFIMGVLLRENAGLRGLVVSTRAAKSVALPGIFCLVYLLSLKVDIRSQSAYPLRIVIGALGSVCVINISNFINGFNKSRSKAVLTAIGVCSMTIYLFHTLFESAVRIGFRQVITVQFPFEVVVISAVLAGVTFPLLLEKYLLRKYGFTRRFLLGLG